MIKDLKPGGCKFEPCLLLIVEVIQLEEYLAINGYPVIFKY